MKRGYLYIAITTLLFSSMEVALKSVSEQFDPIQMTFSRFFVGGLILIPLVIHTLKKRGVRVDANAIKSFAFLGLMGIAISMTFYQLAVTKVPASVVGVLFSSNPIFVTVFAFFMLHESISKSQVAGLILDVLGIVIIISPWDMKLSILGVIYTLVATLLFSIYGVCGKKQCTKFGGTVVTCFSFLFGSAEMMLVAAMTHIPSVAAALTNAGMKSFSRIPFFSGYTLASLPLVFYVFIGVTGIGFTCYFLAMEATSAQQTSLVFFFKPALAPILAFFILHDEISGNMLAGIGLILCGSLISLLPGLLAARAGKRKLRQCTEKN